MSRALRGNISASWIRPPGFEPLVGERQQPPKSLSVTDPSAALTSTGKSKIVFAYGTNYFIDTKAAIIVDVEASPARRAAEVVATRAMIDRTKERFGLHPKKFAADTACGSGGNLAWLVDRKIEPHIPIFERSSQTNGVFARNDFSCDRDADVYLCPSGKALRRAWECDNGVIIYRAQKRDCFGCPLKPQCTTASVRSLSVNADEDVRHLKHNLNFRCLRLRGMSGARDECTLAAVAQNLRKLVRLIGFSPPEPAGACVA